MELGLVEGGQVEPSDEQGTEQATTGRHRLQELVAYGERDLKQLRKAYNVQERARVKEETEKRQARAVAVEDEEEGTKNAIRELEARWGSILTTKFSLPQELLKEIQEQKQRSDALLSHKRELVTFFEKELRDRDGHYVNSLEKFSKDVDELLQTMGSQFRTLQETCEKELQDVEAAFLVERKELLEGHKEGLAELTERRKHLEEEQMEKRAQRALNEEASIDKLREEEEDSFQKMKADLENEIHGLEQGMVEHRSKFQLNAEKMEYNYRALRERDLEYSVTIASQNRKAGRLQKQVAALKTKNTQLEKEFKVENTRLTDEYNRVTKQYKDLQQKLRNFEHGDSKRYRAVFSMNEDIVQTLSQKVMQADQVITREHLGTSWVPPYALTKSSAGPTERRAYTMQDVQLAAVCQKLRDESGIADTKRIEEILSALPHSEEGDILLDEVENVLHLQDETEKMGFRGILSQLLPADAPLPDAKEMVWISPEIAIKAVAMHVDDHLDSDEEDQELEQENGDVMTRPPTQTTRTGFGATAGGTGRHGKRKEAKREQAEHFHQIACVVSDRKFGVWKALLRGMKTFHQQLTQRAQLVKETMKVKEENEELRALLQQYANSKIHEELLIPPFSVARPPCQPSP
eukprot:TRINITY_DN681_c0_g1_i1.p1 TRINITY_DN681_c0_g1~~TRINITY_DN681_c0_g1_i1.p1  ORF type:complete len:679 (+),score=175.98 TRINITY_DN681_c0_g1_i1:133-2037(+)